MDANGSGVVNTGSGGPISRKTSPSNGISWQQALSIDMANILYLHCHQVRDFFIFLMLLAKTLY